MASRWLPNAPWPDDEVEKLRAWRTEGIGNVEIAKRIGRSKAAVVAKVRALHLPNLDYKPTPPPSTPAQHKEPQRAGAVTLPALPSLQDC